VAAGSEDDGAAGSIEAEAAPSMSKIVMRAKQFDKLDGNGNGVLDGEELIGLAE
jgi:hypothetical protein